MVNDSSFSFDLTFCLSITVVSLVWENVLVVCVGVYVSGYEPLYSKILSFIYATFSGYSCLTVLTTRQCETSLPFPFSLSKAWLVEFLSITVYRLLFYVILLCSSHLHLRSFKGLCQCSIV